MHNLKDIRKNLEHFKKKLNNRNTDINFDILIKLDKENRDFIQKKEILEQEKKSLSKTRKEENFEKSKKISEELDKIIDKQLSVQEKINNLLASLPNLPLDV